MIIYCCRDLIFATKIGSTAEAIGVGARPARDAEKLSARLGEGADAVMVDLEMPDAADLIRQAKLEAPNAVVIAFGSHVATEVLQAARDAGADQVLPRSAFSARLPQLLQDPSG